MLSKKAKVVIISLSIILWLFGIGFTKVKLSSFTKVVVPSLSVSDGNNNYYVDGKNNLYTQENKGNSCKRLLKSSVDKAGLIIFAHKLFFINSGNKKVCSMDLNGENLREFDKCSSATTSQPIFKLGKHVYYYDYKNMLTRIDELGKLEKVETVI